MVLADDMINLGLRLKEIREYLGLSQQYVSEKTSISRVAISQIERGKRKVDSIELEKLSKLYNYPVSYFLGQEDDDPHINMLARATKDLSTEDVEQVIKYAEFLKGFGQNRKQ